MSHPLQISIIYYKTLKNKSKILQKSVKKVKKALAFAVIIVYYIHINDNKRTYIL